MGSGFDCQDSNQSIHKIHEREVMLDGQTIAKGANQTCQTCGKDVEFGVFNTVYWYIGTKCDCGPYSRDTFYFKSQYLANQDWYRFTGRVRFLQGIGRMSRKQAEKMAASEILIR